MEFYNIAKDVFDAFKTDTWGNVFFFNIIALFPEIVPKLGIWPESAVKIRNMTQKIMAERDEKNVTVGDFVDRYLNNYFDFHVCLSIRPCVRVSVRVSEKNSIPCSRILKCN